MSQLTCAELVRGYLHHLGEHFSCREQRDRVWIVSPYSYPDGDLVEVSVKEVRPGEAAVTDLGETLRHLANLGFDPRATRKGSYLLEEILKQHRVEVERGMLVKRVPLHAVGLAMQEVLTACLAVSHLVFLSRGFRPATFAEEVAHYLVEWEVRFVRQHPEMGRTGKRYFIDFLIRGRKRDGLLETLSPTSRAGVTPMVNATFRLWSDVPNERWRATLIDDRTVEWLREDILLLEGVSQVYRWREDERDFRRALMAVIDR